MARKKSGSKKGSSKGSGRGGVKKTAIGASIPPEIVARMLGPTKGVMPQGDVVVSERDVNKNIAAPILSTPKGLIFGQARRDQKMREKAGNVRELPGLPRRGV